ncbi:MAG TPA: 50S ribosomal protein L11 methyltransferase [Roseiflexaceae bacterium]|nr:50S ribosomal protein L11 methyltransferase [Roseiflexaceae bacterium]
MSWLEFAVEVDAEAVEPVSELLAQHGYNGGVVVDQPIIPGSDGPEYTYDTARPVTVRTYLPADEVAEDARARIEQALWHLGRMRTVGPLRVTTVEEQDWANAWKQHYTIQRLGARTVIVPSWLEYEPQPDDLVLRLDPGMAFGTGLHPTTQLCIGFLERYVTSGDTVVDLGSGSGILSLVAALSGAGRVLGLDTDPIAVEATRDNAARNGLSDRISAAEGSLGRGALLGHWLQGVPDSLPEAPAGFSSADAPIPQCDLIVANIIAKVLVMLSADIAAALRPDGILISSGIIADREDEVALAFAAAGLTRLERVQQGDWVALVHRKDA